MVTVGKLEDNQNGSQEIVPILRPTGEGATRPFLLRDADYRPYIPEAGRKSP